MAGITFLLEKHLYRPPLSRSVLREGIEAFEAVGPWFLTLLCLAVMGLSVQLMTDKAPVLFYLLLTYASAISLVVSSPFHTMLNRYIADEVYRVNYQPIINGLITLTIGVVAVVFLISFSIVFFFAKIPMNQKIGFVSLSTLLSMFWCISSFLSSIQKERILLVLFSAGMAGMLLLYYFTKSSDAMALLLIFSFGISVPVAGGYAYSIKLYLRSKIRVEWNFLKRPGAIKIGLSIFFFYLGFWMDKVMFWFSGRTGIAYDPLFHYCPQYDFPFFVALSIMMIGSVLVYRGVKRKITDPYTAFISKLANNFPFRDIAFEKYRLVDGIGQVSSSILLFYGGLSVFVLFLVYIQVIPIPWSNPFIFHYLLVGTIFFSLYFFYFLLIQYLDEYDMLLRLNILFFLLNFFGSLITIKFGARYYGCGFLFASAICALVSFFMVNSKVGGLEYHVFLKALRQSYGEE